MTCLVVGLFDSEPMSWDVPLPEGCNPEAGAKWKMSMSYIPAGELLVVDIGDK
jgi:hypothetical protein